MGFLRCISTHAIQRAAMLTILSQRVYGVLNQVERRMGVLFECAQNEATYRLRSLLPSNYE